MTPSCSYSFEMCKAPSVIFFLVVLLYFLFCVNFGRYKTRIGWINFWLKRIFWPPQKTIATPMPSSAPVPIYWDTVSATQPRLVGSSYHYYLRASNHDTNNCTSCLVFGQVWALCTVRASNPTERAAWYWTPPALFLRLSYTISILFSELLCTIF